MPRQVEAPSTRTWYKLFNVPEGVQRDHVCDILRNVCDATLMESHFNGCQGINMVLRTAPGELLTSDQRTLICERIARLMPSGGAAVSIQKELTFEQQTRKPTRLLRCVGFFLNSRPSSQLAVESLGFCVADWVADAGVGPAKLCEADYAKPKSKSKPKKQSGHYVKKAKGPRRSMLNVVLQLPTEEAVQRAVALSHSTLDMLTVPYAGGRVVLYVSQPGDKRKWYSKKMVKRTAMHITAPLSHQMTPPPQNNVEHADYCCVPAAGCNMPQHMQNPAFSLNDDDYNDYLSRVPEAGYDMPQHMPSPPSLTATPQMTWSHSPYPLE